MKKVALALVALFALVTLGCSSSDSPAASTDTTVEAPGNDSEAAPGEADEPSGPTADDIVVGDLGFSMVVPGENASAGAVITNNASETALVVDVEFAFKDAGGAVIGTDRETVLGLAAGASAYPATTLSDVTGNAASVEAVVTVSASSAGSPVSFAVTDVVVTPAQIADDVGIKVSGSATNSTSVAFTGGEISCIVRSGGAIVGGVKKSGINLEPGASMPWDRDDYEIDAGDAAECSGGALTY